MERKPKSGEKTDRILKKRKAKEKKDNKKKTSKIKARDRNVHETEPAVKRHKRIPYAKTKIKRPTYREMIIRSFSDVGKHKTLSKQAILAYICKNRSKTIATSKPYLKAALKRCVADGYIKQVKE